ncbi:MAG TPA: phosphoglucosamine mutase [Planctomycetota bacterium]|nr:phosphoglucosamine mutase [Planctomycetota bacterium]
MTVKPLRCVVSVSGVRGVVGESLDVDQIMALASAYGVAIADRGPVVVGRDSRPTGELFTQAVATGLRGVGCEVIDIGLVPTPTVPITIGELGAAGGIQVSASHNPVQWNALKFFAGTGRNIDQVQLDGLLAEYERAPRWVGWQKVGRARSHGDALRVHIARVLAAVDAERIRRRAFHVVIDSVNGAGSVIAPDLLAQLGCRVTTLYTRPDLPFPRDPEPNAANVTETGAVVRAVGADLGFVQDPDADRLAIIAPDGTFIGEEYTLVLAAAAKFAAGSAGGQGPVACTNLSTSRMLEDVAKRSGGRVVRAKVGEAHVVDAMQANNAAIGGEGNGGVIDPRVVMGRDSQIGMALVLDFLSRRGFGLGDALAEIPRYAMHKEKIALDRAQVAAAIEPVRAHALARGAEIDVRDGIKLMWPDRWVHLRASGTEPVSRIIAEAPDADAARDLAVSVRQAVGARVAGAH